MYGQNCSEIGHVTQVLMMSRVCHHHQTWGRFICKYMGNREPWWMFDINMGTSGTETLVDSRGELLCRHRIGTSQIKFWINRCFSLFSVWQVTDHPRSKSFDLQKICFRRRFFAIHRRLMNWPPESQHFRLKMCESLGAKKISTSLQSLAKWCGLVLKRIGVPRSLSPPSGNWLDDHHRIQVLLYLSLGDESLGPGSGSSFSSDGLIRCDEKCQVAILLPIFCWLFHAQWLLVILSWPRRNANRCWHQNCANWSLSRNAQLLFFFVVSHVPKMGKKTLWKSIKQNDARLVERGLCGDDCWGCLDAFNGKAWQMTRWEIQSARGTAWRCRRGFQPTISK